MNACMELVGFSTSNKVKNHWARGNQSVARDRMLRHGRIHTTDGSVQCLCSNMSGHSFESTVPSRASIVVTYAGVLELSHSPVGHCDGSVRHAVVSARHRSCPTLVQFMVVSQMKPVYIFMGFLRMNSKSKNGLLYAIEGSLLLQIREFVVSTSRTQTTRGS